MKVTGLYHEIFEMTFVRLEVVLPFVDNSFVIVESVCPEIHQFSVSFTRYT